MNNVYDSNDPQLLLRLKKQEADALRDVIRSLNHGKLRLEQIFKISQNTLLAQLGVKKMTFIYKGDEGFIVGFNRGFDEFDTDLARELPDELGAVEVTAENFPALHGHGVEYTVPAQHRNGVGAWILVADFASSEEEKESDLIFIETIGNVLSTAIENRRLIDEMVTQESVRRELDLAGAIQQQLLVRDFTNIQGAKIAALNIPHHKIGGDFYDVVPRSGKGFFICIADVAGKGISAAMLMANTQARLRGLILSETSVSSLIQKLNKHVLAITEGHRFVTFFFAHVRTENREIDYINAGHNPGYLLQTNELRELDSVTVPLGIVPIENEIETRTISYAKGDILMLYTDGLTEQQNEADELLGEDRVKNYLCTHKNENISSIVNGLQSYSRQFAGQAENSDDITMLGIRFL